MKKRNLGENGTLTEEENRVTCGWGRSRSGKWKGQGKESEEKCVI